MGKLLLQRDSSPVETRAALLGASLASVPMAIRFYAMGEADWYAPAPVPAARFDRSSWQERSHPGDTDPAL